MSSRNESQRAARPRVAIIYSEGAKDSAESVNLATYLSCCFASSGYASIFLVPCASDGTLVGTLPETKRMHFVPPTKTNVVEVPVSDITYSHWSILESCHMVIVTVNSSYNDICASKLVDAVQSRKDIMVFAIQRGLTASTEFKDKVQGKSGITCIDCAVGFAVVRCSSRRLDTYTATVQSPSIAMVRLNKDILRVAEGPVNLLETTNIHIFFKKTITTHEWGIALYEHVYALNMVAGGTIQDTLRSSTCRRIYAAMLRESYQTLSRAARYGAWSPCMEMYLWGFVSPKLIEMALLLPTPLFQLFCLVTQLPAPPLPSPGLADVLDGRKPLTAEKLHALILLSKQLSISTPVCIIVHNKLVDMLQKLQAHSSNTSPSGSTAHLDELEIMLLAGVNEEDESGSDVSNLPSPVLKVHYAYASRAEFNFWVIRILGGMSFLSLVIFLLFVD